MVTRQELLAAGISANAIDRRLRNGFLHAVHHGLYSVGRRNLDRPSTIRAALLACGPGCLASHRTAAELLEILDAIDGPIHVTVLRSLGHRPDGVAGHRVRTLPPQQIRDGIPVTRAARTLLDLAESEDTATLRRALNEALYQRLTSPVQLERLMSQATGRRGVKRLRDLLPTSDRAHSPLEDLFLPLLARAGLPTPQTNTRIAGWEVDAVWFAERVAVELDSWSAHGTRTAFEQDRRKGNAIERTGFHLLRFTYDRLKNDAFAVVAELAAALYSADSSHQ